MEFDKEVKLYMIITIIFGVISVASLILIPIIFK